MRITNRLVPFVIALVVIAGCSPGSSGSTPTDTPQIEIDLDSPEPEAPVDQVTEAPASDFETFGDGTWEVGSDIKAGTYRLREPADVCYWARLSGFGGSTDDIIANDNVFGGYAVVTIGKKDVGFESDGCGQWSKDLSQVTSSRTQFGDGTFIVKTDIAPGEYRNSGGETCYWARLKGFSGQLSHIIANDNVFGGSTIVTIASTDKGFTSTGCGTWKKRQDFPRRAEVCSHPADE